MNVPLVASYANIQSPLPFVLTRIEQNSNSFPLRFSYNLAEHPLLQVPRLVKLMDFIASQAFNKVTCVATGRSSSSSNWSGCIHQENFAEIVAHTEEIGLLILIQDAQKDPEYQALLEQIVNELEQLTGQLLKQRSGIEAYIFIAPPITTSRPLNCETNFLFQVHEEKALQENNHSVFISSISFPGEDRTASLNLFLVKPTISNSRESDSRSEKKQSLYQKNRA